MIKKMKACNVQTSISSIVGSVNSFYMEWLKTKFPEGFFKSTYVAGMLSSIENEKRNMIKRPRPMLALKPEYTGENGLMEELPYWHNTLQYTFRNSKDYYTSIFYDSKNQVKIFGIPDRVKVVIPTKILVPTRSYGINVLHYLKNVIEPGGYFYINDVYFENELPRTFMHVLLSVVEEQEGRKLNLNTVEDREIFENYLMINSFNGIVSRRNLSSGNFEYVFKHKTNILVTMESIPTMQSNMRNRSEDTCMIDFQLTFEINNNSNYILELDESKKLPPFMEGDHFGPERNTFTFNITIPYDSIQEQIGDNNEFRLRFHKKFVCDSNVAIDNLPFEGLLNERTNKFLDKYIDGTKLTKEVCRIVLYVGRKRLPDSEYSINWKTKEVFINRPIENANYMFAFYDNKLIMNTEDKDEEAYKKVKIRESK